MTSSDAFSVRHRRVGNPVIRPSGPWQTLAVVVAVALAVILISQTGFGAAILRAFGLESRQTGYTALAFTYPVNLPEQEVATSVKLPLAFSIQNATNTAHHYGWEVLLVNSHQQQKVLVSGSMDLRPGTTGPVARSLKFACSGRVQILVTLTHTASLTHRAEHIDAWLSCPG